MIQTINLQAKRLKSCRLYTCEARAIVVTRKRERTGLGDA